MLYERLVRPGLFRLGGGDPEAAHDAALRVLAGLGALLRRVPAYSPPGAARTVFGVRFPNPVGLAAGMDKDGLALPAWPALGFGFVEVGTVTWHAQLGNARPRLHRLPASTALINQMGFNNAGAQALASRLAGTPPILQLSGPKSGQSNLTSPRSTGEGGGRVPLGISLGKSAVTPLGDAVDDYLASYRVLRAFGDYFAVNVSSPNTPGLRRLQDREQLAELLGALVGDAPILVKIAPDLTDHAVAEIVAVCLDRGAAGVIAANTTLARTGLAAADAAGAAQAGGLSGAPLAVRAREVVAFVHREAGGRLPVVGVGGIMSPDDAARMFDAGASLVQLCTGLVYAGPALVRAAARRAQP